MSSEIAFSITLFIISIPIIIKSSDIFTEGSSRIAKMLGVSDFVIGITVVALGTSLPELASDAYASYINHGQIAIGDIIGSNITNIALILGMTCIIKPLVIKHTEIYSGWIHFIILILASAFILVTGGIGRIGGIAFILIYVFYLRYTINSYREIGVETIEKNSFMRNILEVFIGLIGILLGSRILVNSMISLSAIYGVSEYLIALLLMSFGTSLPEFFVSISAARKGYMTMALGNIIGSNIANILWVLGIAGIINPISISPGLVILQILFMLFLSLLLIIFKRSGYVIDRKEGLIFVVIYVIFIAASLAYGNDFQGI